MSRGGAGTHEAEVGTLCTRLYCDYPRRCVPQNRRDGERRYLRVPGDGRRVVIGAEETIPSTLEYNVDLIGADVSNQGPS